MADFLEKVIWFEPNEFTTIFTLTAIFADGTQSVYNFTKQDNVWLASDNNDNRLQITPPGAENKFMVKGYENDAWSQLQPVYANASASVNGEEVNLIRVVFDKTFDFSTNIIGSTAHSWSIFNENDLKPIEITSYTPTITLPVSTISNSNFYGWGLLNETVPESELQTLDNIHYYAPISWYRHVDIHNTNGDPWNVVHRENYSDVNRGLDNLMSMPVVNNQYKVIPLYYSAGRPSFKQYLTDYRQQ